MQKIKAFLAIVVAFFLVALPLQQSVSAKSVDAAITISADKTDVDEWESFRINIDFTLPNNTIVAGDTTTIKLPDEIKFTRSGVYSFDVYDTNNNTVLTASVDSDTKTMVLTYTDYAETHSDISGSLFFYVQVDTTVVTSEQDINLNFDVNGKPVSGGTIHYNGPTDTDPYPVSKVGWFEPGVDQQISYMVAINSANASYPHVVYQDTLQNVGMSFTPGSFEIYKGTWVNDGSGWNLTNKVDVTNNFNVEVNGTSFTIDFGDINGEGYQVNYKVDLDYVPAPGEEFKNDGDLLSNDVVFAESTAKAVYIVSGGGASGYNFSILIHKVNEAGMPLSGAEFDIIRKANGVTVGTLVTDDMGYAQIDGLLKDDYAIVETKAPNGYQLPAAAFEVSGAEFSTGNDVEKEIVNFKEVTPDGTTTNNNSSTLPNTGENAVPLFIGTALSLLGLAAIIIVKRK